MHYIIEAAGMRVGGQTVDKVAKARRIKINQSFCLPCKGRWVQLVALGGIVKKRLGHRVQAVFGAFCLLLGGSTIVQLPLAKYKIYLTFSKSTGV